MHRARSLNRYFRAGVVGTGLSLAAAGLAHGAMSTTAIIKDFNGTAPLVYRAPIILDAGKLHIDTSGFSGPDAPTAIIYRTDQRKIWQLDHRDKSYLELDEKLLVSMSSGMDRALKSIDEFVRGKPAAGAPPAPALEARSTGARREIMGLSCRQVEIWKDQQRLQEVWVADWSGVGMPPDNFQVLIELGRSYERIWATAGSAPMLRAVPAIPVERIAGLDGYPVLIRQFEGTRQTYEIILGRPTDVTAPPAAFEVPAGYRKRLLF
jgi:hypothetical protein